jgi:hypothetical protein
VLVKREFLGGLATHVELGAGRLYRLHCIRQLLACYYEKAANGPVTRRQVINKALQHPLAGVFGGDWMALLSYAGEMPHPEEQVITTLPETRLFVGGARRAAEVAARQGLPVAEVERMLAAYWSQPTTVSPVERRVGILQRFWNEFDAIHARQAPGMPPLWGLIEERGSSNFFDGPTPIYQRGLYRQCLSADLRAQIEELWGAVMLERWPDRIVTEPCPHALKAEAFGPALRFWHGCALTAWFICEGPYSRTDIPHLTDYYKADLTSLQALGTPVESTLFGELAGAEAHLGDPEPRTSETTSEPLVQGIQVTLQISTGSRRAGFERLRDIITAHRQTWAQRFLDRYLHAHWEAELREAGRQYYRLLAESDRTPTIKRFARYAAPATNHWFGGNISGLYGALGERLSISPSRVAGMPEDRAAFVQNIFINLGGKAIDYSADMSNEGAGKERTRDFQLNSLLMPLAVVGLRYIQLEEALRRPPTLQEFGRPAVQATGKTLGPTLEDAWLTYTRAVARARDSSQPPVRSFPVNDPPISQAQVHYEVAAEETREAAPSNRQPWWRRLLHG